MYAWAWRLISPLPCAACKRSGSVETLLESPLEGSIPHPTPLPHPTHRGTSNSPHPRYVETPWQPLTRKTLVVGPITRVRHYAGTSALVCQRVPRHRRDRKPWQLLTKKTSVASHVVGLRRCTGPTVVERPWFSISARTSHTWSETHVRVGVHFTASMRRMPRAYVGRNTMRITSKWAQIARTAPHSGASGSPHPRWDSNTPTTAN